MRCDDVRSRVEEARLGLLSRDERRRFHAHLDVCAECTGEVAEAKAFEGILDLARDQGRDESFLAELLGVRRRVRRRRQLSALAVAAMLLIVVGVSLGLRGPARLDDGQLASVSDPSDR